LIKNSDLKDFITSLVLHPELDELHIYCSKAEITKNSNLLLYIKNQLKNEEINPEFQQWQKRQRLFYKKDEYIENFEPQENNLYSYAKNKTGEDDELNIETNNLYKSNTYIESTSDVINKTPLPLVTKKTRRTPSS